METNNKTHDRPRQRDHVVSWEHQHLPGLLHFDRLFLGVLRSRQRERRAARNRELLAMGSSVLMKQFNKVLIRLQNSQKLIVIRLIV